MSPADTLLARPRPRSIEKRERKERRATSLFNYGEPMVWLTGGALALALSMIAGLLLLVFVQGFSTFWPQPVVRLALHDGSAQVGEVTVDETFRPGPEVLQRLDPAIAASTRARLEAAGGVAGRRMLRTGNYELTGEHFRWVSDFEVREESLPEWAIVVERLAWGRFYGEPRAFKIGGEVVASTPADSWRQFEAHHGACLARVEEARELEVHAIGAINAEIEAQRLAVRGAELEHGLDSPEHARAKAEFAAREPELQHAFTGIEAQIHALRAENSRYEIVFGVASGAETTLKVADVVRAYPANQLGIGGAIGVYVSRWREFLFDAPRESNSEGGVFPAIFGTVLMTLLMSVLVVPFGVLAALYLREYARQGVLVSAVRVAVNNLAGVPSIVFGVFGLGFFCYIFGGGVDELFFSERLPNPTYGKGGLMWAAFTLALLTLPVVIVATEEALSAVPGSMREGSYACGATKWQTIQRIVLPRAMPGIMTGMILAIARGAGEVAPLMLVGAVKLVPELAIDGTFPYLHPERSFMHLGFHIYDLGFQSQNSEAAKPMVYTTTLLLIGIIVVLNLTAIWVRGRLRRKFAGGQF